jgi:hypothetical protein
MDIQAPDGAIARSRTVVHQFEAKRSGAPRRYEPEKRAARELWIDPFAGKISERRKGVCY